MTTVGLVVGRFYPDLAAKMEAAARERLAERGAAVTHTVDVNGVYEMPLAADRLARQDDIDAVVTLAAVVTGDTDHDQVVAHAGAQALSRVSLSRDTPVSFGVTGPGMSGAEARERTDYGETAVDAALDLLEQLPGAG